MVIKEIACRWSIVICRSSCAVVIGLSAHEIRCVTCLPRAAYPASIARTVATWWDLSHCEEALASIVTPAACILPAWIIRTPFCSEEGCHLSSRSLLLDLAERDYGLDLLCVCDFTPFGHIVICRLLVGLTAAYLSHLHDLVRLISVLNLPFLRWSRGHSLGLIMDACFYNYNR